jgi:hypothetical protein
VVEVFPEIFPTENISSSRQALFLANNALFDGLAKSSSTNALAKLASLNDEAKTRQLFQRVLGRDPDREELNRARIFLQSRSHEASAATQQLLWALLSSAEFRINH